MEVRFLSALLGKEFMSHLEKVFELLEQIRGFGHSEGCNCSAPVYECGCFDKDQSELAEEAIQELRYYVLDELSNEAQTLGFYQDSEDD
jgi:hypothetical protein